MGGMTTTLTRPAALVRRFYETFTIRWADGAAWSGYDTAEEAQAVLDFAATRGSGRRGTIARNEFSVVFDPSAAAALWQPGIRDEPAEAAGDPGEAFNEWVDAVSDSSTAVSSTGDRDGRPAGTTVAR